MGTRSKVGTGTGIERERERERRWRRTKERKMGTRTGTGTGGAGTRTRTGVETCGQTQDGNENLSGDGNESSSGDGIRVRYIGYTESGENHNLWPSMGFVIPLYTSVGSYYTFGEAPSKSVCLRRVPRVVLTSLDWVHLT